MHGIPGSRRLVEGDLVSIDCGAIVDGWHGDAAVSFVVGGRQAGAEDDLALIDATEESMWAGIAALRVGSPLFDVGAAVEDAIVAAGQARDTDYGIVEDYVGHGIGTEMHQDPQVPNYRVRDRGPTVRSGLTVAIEPMVTLGSAETRVLADDWTVVTQDGGARRPLGELRGGDRGRALGAHRPRRRPGAARGARRAVRTAVLTVAEAVRPASCGAARVRRGPARSGEDRWDRTRISSGVGSCRRLVRRLTSVRTRIVHPPHQGAVEVPAGAPAGSTR